MCNSFTTTVSKHHNRLAEIVGPLRGQIVRRADIHKVWIDLYPDSINEMQWVILSDHCINHTNKGACKCAKTELSLFERLGKGQYLVRCV